MAYQRGAIRKVRRKDGELWVLRFRENTAEGGRRERVIPIGAVCDLPKERDARKEVDRLGLLVSINCESTPGRIRFDSLAAFYRKAELGPNAARPKSVNTIRIMEHIIRDYLNRWDNCIADDIKPFDIQNWLQWLHEGGLKWPTVTKIRNLMGTIFRVGLLHEKVSKNPVQHVRASCKTDYRPVVITPQQTLTILNSLENPLHYALVLVCSATALRASEAIALRWHDIRWEENRIRVSKRWAGGDGATKNAASDGFVPMHPALASQLKEWHSATPFAKETDFVFPSLKMEGKVPISASMFVKSYLRPAVVAAGIKLDKGQRMGLHNFRHSISNWLINQAKVGPKTVQGLLRHSRIQTTLDLYTQSDADETQAAQGQFLTALGMPTEMVQ